MAVPETAIANGDGTHEAEKAARKPERRRKRRSRNTTRSRSNNAEPRLSAAEASRLNGSKSRGPTSEAGKARSRFNALKHGMAAKSVILPGEDPAELETRVVELHLQLQPRNEIEAGLVNQSACVSWVADRTKAAATARLAHRISSQPLEEARALKQRVEKLGQYLLKEVSRPAGKLLAEKEGGARHPALLVIELEATLTGCDWLLSKFDGVQMRIRTPGMWEEADGFTLVRLLGKYRGELTSDELVAQVLLDSRCLAEDSAERAGSHSDAKERTLDSVKADSQAKAAAEAPQSAPDEIDVTTHDGPACREYRRLVQQFGRPQSVLDETLRLMPNQPPVGRSLRFEMLNPQDADQARQRLTQVIDEHAERIRQMRAVHSEIIAADAIRANDRLAYDPSPEGDRERRYTLAQDRLYIQTIGTFLKVRKAGNDGTVGESETDGGDRFDLAAISPSLARRAGIWTAPAEDEPIRTSTFDSAQGGPERERGVSEMACENGAQKAAFCGAHTTSQTLEQQIAGGEEMPGPNDPGARPAARRAEQVSGEQLTVDQTTATRSPAVTCSTDPLLNPAAASRPEQVSGGPAARRAEQVSGEQLTVDQTTATRSPAVNFSTDQLLGFGLTSSEPQSEAPIGEISCSKPSEPSHVGSLTSELSRAKSPQPATDPFITSPVAPAKTPPPPDAILEPLDQPADIELEEQGRHNAAELYKRWKALPPELYKMVGKVLRQIERHREHGHLSADRLAIYVGFVQKHLGTPAQVLGCQEGP
jgi:hypothetical protein